MIFTLIKQQITFLFLFKVSADMLTASVSVIIPCYNCSQTIQRAIQSVALQTMLPREVILINDASDDATLTTIKELEQNYEKGWMRVINLPKRSGPSMARNAGWEIAQEKYIAFLDADDTWHPKKIERQYTWMEKSGNVPMTGHLMTHQESITKNLGNSDVKPIKKYKALMSNPFSTPTVMIRRTIKFRFYNHLWFAEDYLLWLTIILKSGHCYIINETMAYMYKKPFGESGLSSNLWKMEKGELFTYKFLYKERCLNTLEYCFFSAYSFLKFFRRLVLRKCLCK